MFTKKRWFLVIFSILIIIISRQVAFALENDTGLSIESNQAIESNVDLIEEDIVEDSSGSGNDLSSDSLNSLDTSESEDSISSQDNYTLFFISDNPGTNILDAASHELFNEHDFKNVNIIVRSGQQIKTMEELELVNLLYSSDAFIGEWISTDVDAVLTSTIEKYPDVVEKQIFLILEPPSGNMNSGSSSINLIKQNTINYNRILSSFSTDDIITYFSNTQRGTA